MATGYAADQSSQQVDMAPFAQSGTISDGNVLSVTFLNMTDHVTVTNTTAAGATSLKVGFSAGGVAAAAYVQLLTGESITLNCRTKLICLLRGVATTTTYSMTGALRRNESQTYPDITTGNGFEKV